MSAVPSDDRIAHAANSSLDARAPAPATRVAPMLAVCGLCGGAGASTLSYLLACRAAASLDGPVLICDTGGPTGGLAAIAGTATQLALPEIAEQTVRGAPLERCRITVHVPGATLPLHLIAATPRVGLSGSPPALRALLAGTRSSDETALIVVDCGTVQRGPDRLVLRQASHVAWVLPANADAVVRAERMLHAMPALPGTRECVVGRGDALSGPPATLGELTRLAIRRRAPLVLVPELRGGVARLSDAIDVAAAGLDAILERLRR